MVGMANLPPLNNQVEKGIGLLHENPLEDSALKVLQLAPLCLSLLRKMRFIIARPRRSRRLHKVHAQAA